MSAKKHRIYHRLQLVAHSLQKYADRRVATISDLTTAQGAVLSILVNGEGSTQKEVAARLGLNESAMTPMIDRLMRLGYLHRTRSTNDRRSWDLSVSAAGLSVLDEIKVPFQQVNRLIDSELSPAQVGALAATLDRLIVAVSAELPLKNS